jgi:hypothetical protein
MCEYNCKETGNRQRNTGTAHGANNMVGHVIVLFILLLLDDLKEKKRYWKLKEEALDRTLWRTRVGRGYGPVVRQTAE